jgi:hypothetical protein
MPQHRQSVQYIRKSAEEGGRGTAKQRERIIQRTLVSDLNAYPVQVDFYCDWASGAFLTKGQNDARLAMASRNGWVDIFIAEPREGYHGLFIELKREGVRPILKNGSLSADPQIQKEGAFLERQRAKGYKAEFGVGYAETKRMIDKYLGVKVELFDDDMPF